ncbi:MAG: class A beta-lactamase-related serine hydrolase [Caulobacteraceae bacterium]|nr:class A beta-lactamase-related serine hydrolase [Caulobacteraceae bacterium]
MEFSVSAARADREAKRRARCRARRRALVTTVGGAAGLAALTAAWLTPPSLAPGQGEAPRALWVGLTLPAPVPQPPQRLQAHLEALGQDFPGRAGIAVRDIQADWIAGHDLQTPYPQQSVSKLWVALTVLEAADQGTLSLDDPVVVRREDLSIFHQPIRDKVRVGPYRTRVADLLESATTRSDNAANDVLMRLVGGPDEVRRLIEDKALGQIGFADEERYFQTAIAGLEWRPDFSFGRTFWQARQAMPQDVRLAALESYLAAPPDGAAPEAIVTALDRLASGELLTPAATDHLLALMGASVTGPDRLAGGLAEGWSLAHKTGTGQVMGPRATGYNDVGLLRAPDGKTYAVAVMIAETTATVPERQALMQAVTRSVIAHHQGLDPAAPPTEDFEFTPDQSRRAALDLRPVRAP